MPVTAPEIVVVVVGLIAGWTLVHLLMAPRRRERGLDELLTRAHDAADREWPAILGVSPRVSQAQIRSAYERKLDALIRATPRVMTEREKAKVDAARASLERAYAQARAAGE